MSEKDFFTLFIESLKSDLQNTLPGREAQAKMMPVIHESHLQYFNDELKLRPAAVMIMLFAEDSKIKTVFIERTPDPGPHSGQIAFPGGRKDPEDTNLIETAIRETNEEVGVSLNRNQIIGNLTPIEIPISGYSVLPVISVLPKRPDFMVCYEEVNDIFVVDLLALLKIKQHKTVPARGIHIETPCYMFDETIIWGATAMVLSEFEEVIKEWL